MSIFYAPICPVYNRGKSLSLDASERGTTSLDVQSFHKVLAAYPPAMDFMARAKSSAQSVPVVYQPRYVRWILFLMAGTHLPLLLIALALVTVVLAQEKHRRELGWLAALVLLGYLYNAAACLEVAIVHSLEIRRYLTVQMYLTLFVQFLAGWFILEFALGMRARRNNHFLKTPGAKDFQDGALGSGNART
jgi:hypothetical protein